MQVTKPTPKANKEPTTATRPIVEGSTTKWPTFSTTVSMFTLGGKAQAPMLCAPSQIYGNNVNSIGVYL